MEYAGEQRRYLLCAAVFSFGAVCAVLTVLRLSPEYRGAFVSSAEALLDGRPLWMSMAMFMALPAAAFLLGAAPLGPILLLCLDGCCGALLGFGSAALVLRHGLGFAPLLFSLPFSLDYVLLSAVLLRASGLVWRQFLSGGRFRPDLRPCFVRFAAYSFICVFSVLSFWAMIP